MGTKQCPKCIHDEMCKYKEEIEEIMESHSFIGDVVCCRYLKLSTFLDENGDSGSKKTKVNSRKKTEAVKDSEISDTVSVVAESETEKQVSDFDEIGVDMLYLPENVVKVLHDNQIYTVKDLYSVSDWGPMCNILEDVNRQLLSFNRQAVGIS